MVIANNFIFEISILKKKTEKGDPSGEEGWCVNANKWYPTFPSSP
jgi:hypothetical protein